MKIHQVSHLAKDGTHYCNKVVASATHYHQPANRFKGECEVKLTVEGDTTYQTYKSLHNDLGCLIEKLKEAQTSVGEALGREELASPEVAVWSLCRSAIFLHNSTVYKVISEADKSKDTITVCELDSGTGKHTQLNISEVGNVRVLKVK